MAREEEAPPSYEEVLAADAPKKQAWLPLQRDLFRESQSLRQWDRCESRSHPLASSVAKEPKQEAKMQSDGLWDDDALISEMDGSGGSSAKDQVWDPLTAATMAMDDPLSGTGSVKVAPVTGVSAAEKAARRKAKTTTTISSDKEENHRNFENFRGKRSSVLSKFTSNKKVAVTAFFLDEDDDGGSESKQSSRVEQMADDSSLFLSQKEYIKRMENNVIKLRQAWKAGKRVLSLKIAIQCSKMVGAKAVHSCPHFYPSMCILVTEVLDNFGDLVFQRLYEKSVIDEEQGMKAQRRELRPNWTNEDINRVARETCLNWFYKIACIRELLPRLLIELSLFKCWRFVRPNKEYKKILRRLSRTVRGIGDPLVQAYVRTYMVHRGFEVCGSGMRATLLETFDDFLHNFSDLNTPLLLSNNPGLAVSMTTDSIEDDDDDQDASEDGGGSKTKKNNKNNKNRMRKVEENVSVVKKSIMSEGEYIGLYQPAVNWLVHCLSFEASEEEFDAVLKRYQNGWTNSVILGEIVDCFSHEFISKHCRRIAKLIKSSQCNAISAAMIYRSLGLAVVHIPPQNRDRLSLLNDVWSPVSKMGDSETEIRDYMSVASVWIEYVLQHFGKDEIDTMLSDIMKHLKKDLSYRNYQGELYGIVTKVVTFYCSNVDDSSFDGDSLSSKEQKRRRLLELFEMSNLLPIFKLLQSSNLLSATKMLLDEFIKVNEREQMNDALLIGCLLEICRMHHDSLSDLVLQSDENTQRAKKQATDMICHVIDCIDYGFDLEKQLNEYVECRSMFNNLDGVLINLVNHVSNLAMTANSLMRGKHNKKTMAFVKACLAYCHITIPSLLHIWPRMYLFTNVARVALSNCMVTQCEALIEAAISLIAELPTSYTSDHSAVQSTSSLLSEWVHNLSSLLILVPGHPENGPFYLLLTLNQSLNQDYPPWLYSKQQSSSHPPACADKIRAHMSIFKAIVSMSQRKLPYHIENVDSNDVLFGHSKKYLKLCSRELASLGGDIMTMVCDLSKSTERLQKQECGFVSLELLNVFVYAFHLSDDPNHVDLKNQAIELYNIVLRSPNVNSSFLCNTLSFIEKRKPELHLEFAKIKHEFELNQ